MTNYPPGVTGNEPQIAGYPDPGTDVRECQADAATMTRYSVLEAIRDAWRVPKQGELTAAEALDRLQAAIDALDTDEDGVCAFEGPVEITYAHGVESWECPNCGHEHEDEADDGPNPDDARDFELERWMD